MVVIVNHGATDGPTVWIDDEGNIHVQPGWQPDTFADFATAVRILAQTPGLKKPGLAKSTNKELVQFVKKELATYLPTRENSQEPVVVVVTT